MDLTSPYGYGGAFHSGATEVDAKEFWSAFEEFCRSRGVVSEFTRLCLFEDRRLPHPGPTQQKLVNVVRDLRMPQDEMWREFDHKVRKNVNKARRLGVSIEVDGTGARVDDFLRIYEATMDRRHARSTFYFPREFFRTIIDELAGQFVFFHAVHGERIVSTELVLSSADTLYSFLGGTERSAFDLRPNDLLKVEVMRWGQEHGKARFVLGGGYAADDGIFRYKRAFAPHGLVPYSVGDRVFDERTYARLVDAHDAQGRRRLPGWQPDPGFFPAIPAGVARAGDAMSGGDRWEVGAAYPLLLPHGEGLVEPAGQSRLFGSGRQAVRALLEFGRREYGWAAVHVPAYYSPSVVPHIADLLPVRRYDSGPLGPPPGRRRAPRTW